MKKTTELDDRRVCTSFKQTFNFEVSMASHTTCTRMLDAAEQLFAERGFAETSLRDITQLAQVNLAAVNYHFGSKLGLIQAVLDRYLALYMPRLNDALLNISVASGNTLPDLLRAFMVPLLGLRDVKAEAPMLFMQLLGRGYIDGQGHLRTFVTQRYGEVLKLITLRFTQLLPGLKSEELFWRLHFALGSSFFVMSSFDALREIAATDFDQQVDLVLLLERLQPFLAGGFPGAPGDNFATRHEERSL
jgi:AcrR family transcriptional regulator